MTGEVCFTGCEADVVAASRDWFVDSLRRPRGRLRIAAVVGAVALAGMLGAAGDGDGEGSLARIAALSLAAGCVAAAAAYGITYLLVPLRARRLYRQQKVRPQWYRFRWSDEGLHFESPNAQAHYAWPEFQRFRIGRSSLLLFFNDNSYLYLPWHVLTAEQSAELRALAGRSGAGRG